ncbi:Endopolyphosphatase [Phlyctochytrium planicorne]|nr:Endopolyphosphatase [Phlyctochytrium planicorne]
MLSINILVNALMVMVASGAALPPCTYKKPDPYNPAPGYTVGTGSGSGSGSTPTATSTATATATSTAVPVSTTGSILHITDIHVDPTYKEGTAVANLCHRKDDANPALNIAGKFGTINTDCDSPVALLDATFEFLKSNPNTKNPDFIVYTGDFARHDRDTAQVRTQEDTLSDHTAVIKYFSNTWDLKKIPLFPTIGNNDVFDHNSVAINTINPLLTSLLKIWEPLNLGLDKIDTFLSAGYYMKQIFADQPLHVISLNTMWFYKKNEQTVDCDAAGSPGGDMLKWLDVQFKALREKKGTAYIIGHIPPKDEKNKKNYYDNCYDSYNTLVAQNLDVISAHFHGHVNQDMLTYMSYRKDKNKYSLSVINATVLPSDYDPTLPDAADKNPIVHVFTTAPSIIPLFNPSARVYTYSKKPENAGGLLDYTQYYSDLVSDNQKGTVSWDVEYKASDVYGTKDLSTASLIELIKGLYAKDSKTWPLYQKYFTSSYVVKA